MTPPVTQAVDMEMAASYYAARAFGRGKQIELQAILEQEARGESDPLSHMFAQHRAKAIAEETARCAKLADDAQIPARRKALGNPDCAWNDACRDIATAIRATVGEVGNG